MSAADGSPIEIATGIMIAMIDIGPSPGNMPINVPIRQPPMTIKRFCSEKAVCRPIRSPSSMLASQNQWQRAHVNAQNNLDEVPDDPRRKPRNDDHQ